MQNDLHDDSQTVIELLDHFNNVCWLQVTRLPLVDVEDLSSVLNNTMEVDR